MKCLTENDEAISVVVGAILILAVFVTFMSVVTSSWVPVYEGNAEADHSDTTHRTFMDFYKQIEFADEFTNSATIDLGTDDVSFIKNSYSVGYLEVDENSGGLFLTTNLTRIDYSESSFAGVGLELIGINLSSDTPLDEFKFELIQTDGANNKLDPEFMFQLATTNDRWITLYNSQPQDQYLMFIVKYGDPTVRWQKDVLISDVSTTPYTTINLEGDAVLHVDMLDSALYLKLMTNVPQIITDATGSNTTYNLNQEAPLNDIIQHWAKFGESSYFVHYMQYTGVSDGEVYATVENSSQFNTATNGSVYTVTFDNMTGKIGGGTLTMRSDYNFMVDQSYVYDCGAVFLSQDDGEVFKVEPPIVASNNSGTLNLALSSVVLKGDLQASGNGVETLYTTLVGDARTVYGTTNNISIVKETTPKYYDFWRSLFEDIRLFANDFTDINATLTNNTAQTNMTLIISDNSSTQNIDVTVNTKIIQIS